MCVHTYAFTHSILHVTILLYYRYIYYTSISIHFDPSRFGQRRSSRAIKMWGSSLPWRFTLSCRRCVAGSLHPVFAHDFLGNGGIFFWDLWEYNGNILGIYMGMHIYIYIWISGGFHKWGYLNSWMVYFMEHPIKMDELGVPPFQETSIWEYTGIFCIVTMLK